MEIIVFLSIVIAVLAVLTSIVLIRRIKKQIAEMTDALIDVKNGNGNRRILSATNELVAPLAYEINEIVVSYESIPSSIIGMLLLTLFLKLGWIKLHWVQGMSDFLVANLGFFFIPPGVALMLYFDIIAAEFWPIAIASLVSTLLVLVVTGWVHQLTRKIK